MKWEGNSSIYTNDTHAYCTFRPSSSLPPSPSSKSRRSTSSAPSPRASTPTSSGRSLVRPLPPSLPPSLPSYCAADILFLVILPPSLPSANHALSDCHAMNAQPRTALALAVVPLAVSEKKTEALLLQLLAGAVQVGREGGREGEGGKERGERGGEEARD